MSHQWVGLGNRCYYVIEAGEECDMDSWYTEAQETYYEAYKSNNPSWKMCNTYNGSKGRLRCIDDGTGKKCTWKK
jgi:hypothetical protein